MLTRFLKALLWTAGSLALLFVAAYLLTSGDYEVAETAEQDSSIPTVTLGGVTFHSETFGDPDAQPVVIVHGGPGGDYRYLLELKALADDYFVVFYDQRGTGLSPRVNPKEVTVEASIQDLDNIVQHYAGARPVYLIGHSWGAMLSTGYLARFPEKVLKAVIAEPAGYTHEALEDFFAATRPKVTLASTFKAGRAFFESLHVRGPDAQARWDYFGVNAGSSESYTRYYCGGARSGYSFPYWRWGILAAQNLASSSRENGRFIEGLLTDGLEDYPNKVLLVASECNQITGRALQEKNLDFFPNAELAVIPETGHEMFTQDPEASLDVIRTYFDE